MTSLRFPSRISENAFCSFAREECGADRPMGLNLYANNIPRSQLTVKRSSVGDNAGRGVFTQVDIPANSYLDLYCTSHPTRVPWKAKIVWDLVDTNDYLDEECGSAIHYYLEGYGFSDEFWGLQEEVVDCSVLAFINHGCKKGKVTLLSIATILEIILEIYPALFPIILRALFYAFDTLSKV